MGATASVSAPLGVVNLSTEEKSAIVNAVKKQMEEFDSSATSCHLTQLAAIQSTIDTTLTSVRKTSSVEDSSSSSTTVTMTSSDSPEKSLSLLQSVDMETQKMASYLADFRSNSPQPTDQHLSASPNRAAMAFRQRRLTYSEKNLDITSTNENIVRTPTTRKQQHEDDNEPLKPGDEMILLSPNRMLNASNSMPSFRSNTNSEMHGRITYTNSLDDSVITTPKTLSPRSPAVISPSISGHFNNSSNNMSSLTRQPSTTRITRSRTSIFKSSEIGIIPKNSPPFPEENFGTYSCHGIEPCYGDNLDDGGNDMIGIHEKINQDRGCVVHPYGTTSSSHGNGILGDDTALFMVLDGHGEEGDKVSEYVMRHIAVNLEKDPLFATNPGEALTRAYIASNTALTLGNPDEPPAETPPHPSTLMAYTSGCTCITVIVRKKQLIVANVGDSRAVLAWKEKAEDTGTEELCFKRISNDQKADLPEEKARIIASGGFVRPAPEPGLAARVYLDPNFTLIGLAMSRSIGDLAVKNVGVIAEPEILYHELPETPGFCIMGSDGLWEFIEDDEAVAIVRDNMQFGAPAACRALIQEAALRWQEEEGDYRDDITAMVFTLPLPGI